MSLTWNKTILGQFSLLAFNPVRSQWGRYNIPRYIMKNNNSPKKVTQLRWGWKVRAVTSRPKKSAAATVQLCRAVILHIHYSFFKRQTSFDKFWRTTWTFGKKHRDRSLFSQQIHKIYGICTRSPAACHSSSTSALRLDVASSVASMASSASLPACLTGP